VTVGVLEDHALEHVRDGLARVDRGLERLEDVLPADRDRRVDPGREQVRDRRPRRRWATCSEVWTSTSEICCAWSIGASTA
jgi:hypothetical protein